MSKEPKNWTLLAAIIAGTIAIIGWFISARIAFYFGLKKQRADSELAIKQAKIASRNDFIAFANHIKTGMQSGNPMNWVSFFKENIGQFTALYRDARDGLSASERDDIHAAIETAIRMAKMNPGDIYANEVELHEAFLKIPAK